MSKDIPKEPREELIAYIDQVSLRIPERMRDRFIRHIRADAELVARDYLIVDPSQKAGECYFVFMADERPDIVMNGLLNLKNKARAPESLELTLYTKIEEIPEDANLHKIWKERVDFYNEDHYPDNHYMLRGRMPQATNLKAFRIVDRIRGKLLSRRSPFKIHRDEQYCDDIYVKLKGRYEITLDGKTAPYKG